MNIDRSSGFRSEYEVFAHLQAEKSELYRLILGIFTSEKERFAISLRPTEIHRLAKNESLSNTPELTEIEAALLQLVSWGNLEQTPDTAEVATVEQFYHPRYLYQISATGEAAEIALAQFHEQLERPGELQTAVLHEIIEGLESLRPLLAADFLDKAKVHQALRSLFDRFSQLTIRAQSFMRGIQQASELHGLEIDAFIAYKDRLVDYLDRFIGELVLATNRIVQIILILEENDFEPVFDACAERELADVLEKTEEKQIETAQIWKKKWTGLRSWFISENGASQADLLRARARAAIPALLMTVSNLNDRRVRRADRAADFLALARWFAEAPNDMEAHQLWHAAFGLGSSRSLRINEETLDVRESQPESPRTTWLEAEPLWISPRLRTTGRTPSRGSAQKIVDRSKEREILNRLAAEEIRQIEQARSRLANGKRLRLAEIEKLDAHAFQLFLELLGDALSRKTKPDGIVETSSADGALTIRLEPTPDGEMATLTTEIGHFYGRDHWITIERQL